MSTGLIILAAGEGKRFGGPKAIAVLEGSFFYEILWQKALQAGISQDSIVFIINDSLQSFFTALPHVVNTNLTAGMLYSIKLGLNFFAHKNNCLILPVDYPFLQAETLSLIYTLAQNASTDKVLIPSYNMQKGHPICIPQNINRFIPDTDLPGGLANIITSQSIPKEFVNTTDPGILRNVNFLQDLPFSPFTIHN